MRASQTAAIALAILCPAASSALARPIVHVVDTPGLYAAVNDPANAGAIVVLGPGLYALDPNHPNAGRLELQRDMELHGMPGEEAVIDASGLPSGSFSLPGANTGAIRLGRGENAIEWLTIQGARNGASAIATDLVEGNTRVRLAHVIARDNARGLDARNFGAQGAGRLLEVDVSESVFVGHVTAAGQGIRLANANTQAATIRATLRDNRSYGNIAGCVVANISTSEGWIEVDSRADRFDGNGNGCVLLAGIGLNSTTQRNRLTFRAHASTFRDNVGPLPAAFPIPGGVLAIGGQSVGAANLAFGNMLQIELSGVRMEGNAGWDINAYGAFTTLAQPAGADNSVLIALRGVTTRASLSEIASQPPAPGSGNSVVIDRPR